MGNKGGKEKGKESATTTKEKPGQETINVGREFPEKNRRIEKEALEQLDTLVRQYQRFLQQSSTKEEQEKEKEEGTEELSTPITRLSIKRKGLTKFPEGICALKDLECLNLAYNRIEQLPVQLGELTKLTELRCNSNLIAKWIGVPEDWGPSLHLLVKLRVLDLSRNGLRVVPPKALSSLTALEHLDLHGNMIAGLPDTVEELQNLTYLDISENQYIPKLPAGLGKLPNLTVLKANNNRIQVLDKELQGFSALTELNLSVNRTESLPSTFIGGMVNLTDLKCRGSHLSALPDELSTLTKLVVLDLSLSKFAEFPAVLYSCTSITDLRLDVMDTKEMKLSDKLHDLTNLRKLNMAWNSVTAEECEIVCSIPSLVELSLAGCKLKGVPDCLAGLTNLTALDLSFNEFEEMPECLQQMTWLKQLALYHNRETRDTKAIELPSKYTPELPLVREGPPIKWYPFKHVETSVTDNPAVKFKEGMSKLSVEELRDKIYGCIFGHAIGDAIGLSTEFLNKEQANVNYGSNVLHYTDFNRDRHRIRWLFGDFTDDTDQMILILENFLEHGGEVDVPSYALSLLRWANLGFIELGDDGGMGLGSTVGAVIFDDHFLDDPHKRAHEVWLRRDRDAAANGAVMRTSVLGIVNFDDTTKVVANTKEIAQVTHVDPRCTASCIAVTVAIALMLRGETDNITEQALEEALKEDFSVLKDPTKSLDEFKAAISAKTFEELKLDEANAIGYTIKCVGSGFVALRYDSFEEALMYVAREAGDSDTNGAVCGALLGAKLGFNGLPHEWVEGLVHKKWLAEKVEALCTLLGL